MPEFVNGQRVRVSYEAGYGEASQASPGFHWVSVYGKSLKAPPGAITAIADPQPEEPTAPGSVVEVNGVRVARVDENGEPWRVCDPGDLDGRYYHYWDALKEYGPIKVLFDPDQAAENAPTVALPETVVDREGDTWYLKADGKYRLYADELHGTKTLEEIRQLYGIRT